MKRKNAKFPCEKCISFAVCKQKKKIECGILYKYYQHNIIDWYKQGSTKNKRLHRIKLYFEKDIWDFYVTTNYELYIEWEQKHHQPAHAMGFSIRGKKYTKLF